MGGELPPLALRPIIRAEASGDSVWSVVVLKLFARTVTEILDVGAQVSFLGKSSCPIKWFGVRFGPFYPYGVPVLRWNEMARFDNVYQPVSWSTDVQAHLSQEKGKVSFTLVPSMVFLTKSPSEQASCFPPLQSLLRQHAELTTLKRRISFRCVSPASAVTFLYCLIFS